MAAGTVSSDNKWEPGSGAIQPICCAPAQLFSSMLWKMLTHGHSKDPHLGWSYSTGQS